MAIRLSISVLCCSKADVVERCLKSLDKIRESILSELVVVDTGCDKDARAVVEKYADRVLEYTWENDFSKARNFQLQNCMGEWFMYLDDDEYFESCDDIIRFFTMQNYWDYDSGEYIQRNYMDFQGQTWQDVLVTRMFPLTPETHFEGLVHEYIKPVPAKRVVFESAVGHYGYCNQSAEDIQRRAMRNIPLLETMVASEPENLRWPCQLAQEYRAIGWSGKLLELCKQYFYSTSNTDEEAECLYHASFCCGMAIALYDMDRMVEVAQLFESISTIEDEREITSAKLATLVVGFYFNTKRYEKCKKACELYIKAMEHLAGSSEKMMFENAIFLNGVFDSDFANTIYYYLAGVYVKEHKLDMAVLTLSKPSGATPLIKAEADFYYMLADLYVEDEDLFSEFAFKIYEKLLKVDRPIFDILISKTGIAANMDPDRSEGLVVVQSTLQKMKRNWVLRQSNRQTFDEMYDLENRMEEEIEKLYQEGNRIEAEDMRRQLSEAVYKAFGVVSLH